MSDRPNSGVLFKNNRKTKDTHPDYTGHGDYEGTPIELAAWIKDGRNGKFLSLTLKRPSRQAQSSDQQPTPAQAVGAAQKPLEDDVPF